MKDGLRCLVTVAYVQIELGAGEGEAFLVDVEPAVINGVRQLAIGHEADYVLGTFVDGGRFFQVEIIQWEYLRTEQQVTSR